MWITAHSVNTFIEVRDKTFFTPWKEASGEILNTSETMTRQHTLMSKTRYAFLGLIIAFGCTNRIPKFDSSYNWQLCVF